MKKIIATSLALATLTVFADCRDVYERNKGEIIDLEDAAFFTGVATAASAPTGLVFVAATYLGWPGVLAIPVAAFAGMQGYNGIIALQNINENKMIKLINQSEEFLNHGIEGRVLKKLHQKINSKIEVSMTDLASHIQKSNQDLSLCGQANPESFRSLVRKIQNGDVEIVESKGLIEIKSENF